MIRYIYGKVNGTINLSALSYLEAKFAKLSLN